MPSTILLALLAILSLVVILRLRVTFFLFVFAQSALLIIGLVRMAAGQSASWSAAWAGVWSLAALVGGYGLSCGIKFRGSELKARGGTRTVSQNAVWVTVSIVGGLTLWHLLAGGAPVLADNIERARFDFTSSGLFGIPGRMFLFGAPIAWALATASAASRGTPLRRDKPWLVATAVILVSALMSGFRGGVMSAAITIVGMGVVAGGWRIRVHDLVRRYGAPLAIGLGYFALVNALYDTTGDAMGAAFLDRLTLGAAEAPSIALDGRTIRPIVNPIWTDLQYFVPKYLGQPESGLITTERLVGAATIGANPYAGGWVPPVTVSGFAELTAGYGLAIGVIGMVGAGFVFGWCDRAPAGGIWAQTARATIGLALYSWVLKGGTAHHLLNFGFAAVFVLGIAWLVTSRRVESAGRSGTRVDGNGVSSSSSAFEVRSLPRSRGATLGRGMRAD